MLQTQSHSDTRPDYISWSSEGFDRCRIHSQTNKMIEAHSSCFFRLDLVKRSQSSLRSSLGPQGEGGGRWQWAADLSRGVAVHGRSRVGEQKQNLLEFSDADGSRWRVRRRQASDHHLVSDGVVLLKKCSGFFLIISFSWRLRYFVDVQQWNIDSSYQNSRICEQGMWGQKSTGGIVKHWLSLVTMVTLSPCR